MEDLYSREWQGNWEGREATRWTNSIKNLMKKIPIFTQEVFCIGAEVNKYKDIIVREPLSEVRGDFGYDEAITRGRIPIAAMSNNYGGHLFRGRKQGYKLVNHHDLLEEVLAKLAKPISDASQSVIESLEATLTLSIYGARMHVEFLVPHYKRPPYMLKVTCRNSVDGKFALIINLFLYRKEDKKNIPFEGFHHVHTQELEDGAVGTFLSNALDRFLHGTWDRDRVPPGIINKIVPEPPDGIVIPPDINVLQFLEILTELVRKGHDIFQGDTLGEFAKLTRKIHKLLYDSKAR